jgi:hypothetical protein
VTLPSLATSTDLSARGADISNPALVTEMLSVASAVVRTAAQSPILSTTSTVTLTGWQCDQWLNLPGLPVTAVSAVSINGTAVTDFRLDGARLWRSVGWGVDDGPATVVVTLTHGFAVVPPFVRQLVCDLAISGIDAAADGARVPGMIGERVDDYAVQFIHDENSVATVFELPHATRDALRKAFGGGAEMVIAR